MGIKCLLKFLTEKHDLVKEVDNKIYQNKRIAIDISILIYRVIISVRNSGADFTNQKGEITSHILGLFNKTMEILNKGIIPIYIFDGKPPELKYKTIEERKSTKKKAYEKMLLAKNEEDKIKYFKRCSTVTKEQWDQCRELLDLMGIPYINAPEEADSQCAYLAKNGLVDAVLTEDMDILTFGSPKIVRNITSYKIPTTEIKLNDILVQLNLTYDQFIDFCLLLGSDYSNGIENMKPNDIYNYFIQYKNIDKTLEAINKNNGLTNYENNYIETKNYFLNPIINTVTIDELKLKKPKTDILTKKLVEDYGLVKYMIKKKIDKLNKHYDTLSKY
jgi:flap endonuclease-1